MLTEKILFKESAYITKYEGDKNIIDKHIEHIYFLIKDVKVVMRGAIKVMILLLVLMNYLLLHKSVP